MTKEKPCITEKKWQHKGLACKVIFVRQSHRCGYVAVPKGHVAFEKNYDDVDVNVHGGLTYGELGSNKNFYWLGFDCAHAGDKMVDYSLHENDHFWTLEEVIEETNKLAEQLSTLEEWQCLGYDISEFLRTTPKKKLLEFARNLQKEKS